jgi:hypothetical protein
MKGFPLEPKPEFIENFENILYVYPESVNLAALNYTANLSRNVAVKVQFKDNDNDLYGKGLKVFYGKNSHDSYLMESQYTQVTYHSFYIFKFNTQTVIPNFQMNSKLNYLLF